MRIIVDSSLRIPIDSNVLHLESQARTLVATVVGEGPKVEQIRAGGAEIMLCREREGRVDLRDLFARLGARGIQSVLLEGGATLAGEALRLGIIDKFILFYAPKLLGGDGPGLFSGPGAAVMADAARLRDVKLRRFGADFMLEGYPEGPCLPV